MTDEEIARIKDRLAPGADSTFLRGNTLVDKRKLWDLCIECERRGAEIRSLREAARVQSPCNEVNSGFVCTLKKGHEGPHVVDFANYPPPVPHRRKKGNS